MTDQPSDFDRLHTKPDISDQLSAITSTYKACVQTNAAGHMLCIGAGAGYDDQRQESYVGAGARLRIPLGK